MYGDTVKVANKIISYDDLLEIFHKMNETLDKYLRIYKSEEMKNKIMDYKYQFWTYKDSSSSLKFRVNFYDDTVVSFENYSSFIGVFNNRLEEIKSIDVTFRLSYEIKEEGFSPKYYSQSINMWIRENKASLEVNLNNEDKKIDEVYEFIKNKILNAPVKYDSIIKNKFNINTIIGLAVGFIPAIIISTLLIFVPAIRETFSNSFVLYPISNLLIAFVVGGTATAGKMDGLYKNIVPEKKYAGYDNGAIYKDDIDKYVETSEILIGKNSRNLEYRKKIQEEYNKYKKYIPYELIVIFVLSIIVIFL